MYSVLDVQKLEGIWHFCCVKLYDDYRYYGIVFNTEYDYVLISLMDDELKRIDHYRYTKNNQNLSQMFLDFCRIYDSQIFPELFVNNPLS